MSTTTDALQTCSLRVILSPLTNYHTDPRTIEQLLADHYAAPTAIPNESHPVSYQFTHSTPISHVQPWADSTFYLPDSTDRSLSGSRYFTLFWIAMDMLDLQPRVEIHI
jgi:hypothetical protein